MLSARLCTITPALLSNYFGGIFSKFTSKNLLDKRIIERYIFFKPVYGLYGRD